MWRVMLVRFGDRGGLGQPISGEHGPTSIKYSKVMLVKDLWGHRELSCHNGFFLLLA